MRKHGDATFDATRIDKLSLESHYRLSTEYLLAKFGFDTAENEPFKVCLILPYLPRPEI